MSHESHGEEGSVVIDMGRNLARDTITAPVSDSTNIFLLGLLMFFNLPSNVHGSGDDQEGHGGGHH